MTTRTRQQNTRKGIAVPTSNNRTSMKRTAEMSLDEQQKKKRTAFGDLTNAVTSQQSKKNDVAVKIGKKVVQKGTKKTKVIIAVPKPVEKGLEQSSQQEAADESWDIIELSQGSIQSSQESSNHSGQDSATSPEKNVELMNLRNMTLSQEMKIQEEDVVQDWEDIDAQNMNDPYQVALYAQHIFEYYKKREEQFPISDYMPHQEDLTPNMRAILVDWLVEVQENFELNHETLYLAVKIVDHYLDRNIVLRDKLQLIGATALFISCKFDERCPPVMDDFLYICDDAYKKEEMIKTEMEILKSIKYDLGIPISYRFLRRYAKCAKATMDTLTLARFILEHSLMDYTLVKEVDSKIAAACLLLALRMKKVGTWDGTLTHYTGYKQDELVSLVKKLNKNISETPNQNLQTIRSKYSHRVFHEVALTPTLSWQEIEQLTPS